MRRTEEGGGRGRRLKRRRRNGAEGECQKEKTEQVFHYVNNCCDASFTLNLEHENIL